MESFEQYAAGLTYRHCKLLAACFVLAVLLTWPFDRLVYHGNAEVMQALDLWRVGMIGLNVLGLAVGAVSFARGVDLFVPVTLFIAGAAALRGHTIALAANLEQAVFYTGNFIPFATIPLIWSHGRRVVATLIIANAYLVAYFATRPADLQHPFARQVWTFQMFATLMSLGVGAAAYQLVRNNHAQRVALEARSRSLEDLDRAIERLLRQHQPRAAHAAHADPGVVSEVARREPGAGCDGGCRAAQHRAAVGADQRPAGAGALHGWAR